MSALTDCLSNLRVESGGAVDLFVVRPVDAPDVVARALAGDPLAQRVFEALASASRAMDAAPKRKPLLCATCPRPLRGSAFAIGLVLPMRDNPQSGAAFGLCVKCATPVEALQANATKAMHKLWPDLEPIEITHPAGGRA